MYGKRPEKWEIALACAVGVTLLWGLVLGDTPCLGWWGTVYPELSPEAGSAQAVSAAAGGVVLRFRILEWLISGLRTLGVCP